MPDIQEPAWNDSWTSLWRKLAQDYYIIAVSLGFNEPLEPNGLDAQIDSMRKVCVYTAYIADNI